MGISLYLVVSMIDSNIVDVKQAAPKYQENFFQIIDKIYNIAGIDQQTSVTQIKEKINLGSFIANIAGTIASIAGNAGLILIYILFLFLEQKSFDKKIAALLRGTKQTDKVHHILKTISTRIETYVAIKSFVSLLTAIGCYVILKIVGVDFPEFWAFIIFLLNFIPTVGSLLAVLFPALLCLVQFSNFTQFFIVISSLGGIQFLIGNILEPKLMGKSLNISPIVVMLSLSIWGSIWGIAGMFLSVPFTVILMIIFSQFEATKRIAILLSEDGTLDRAEEDEQLLEKS
jgi:predicted PurR-regulated permease PerM